MLLSISEVVVLWVCVVSGIGTVVMCCVLVGQDFVVSGRVTAGVDWLCDVPVDVLVPWFVVAISAVVPNEFVSRFVELGSSNVFVVYDGRDDVRSVIMSAFLVTGTGIKSKHICMFIIYHI